MEYISQYVGKWKSIWTNRRLELNGQGYTRTRIRIWDEDKGEAVPAHEHHVMETYGVAEV